MTDMHSDPSRPLWKPLKSHGQIYCDNCAAKGPYPEVKTPLTPDQPDVVDTGDVVEGLGVDGLATASSSASSTWGRVVDYYAILPESIYDKS